MTENTNPERGQLYDSWLEVNRLAKGTTADSGSLIVAAVTLHGLRLVADSIRDSVQPPLAGALGGGMGGSTSHGEPLR
jgi:hypothetical protein